MKINVNVFIGSAMCILVIAVIGGLYRMNKDQDTWRPGDIYSHLGSGVSYSSVTSASSNNSDKVLVSMRGGRVLGSSRPVVSAPVSYAHAISAPIANSQSPIANISTGALYTTSSATMKSFGGGNMQNGGGMSMSGGSVRTNQSPLAYSQSPIAYSQSPIAYSQLPISNSPSLVAPDAEALMAAAMSYTPITSSISAVGATTVEGSYSGSLFGPRRKAAPTGGGWDAWLNSFLLGGGVLVYTDDDGNRYYDMAALEAAWKAALANGDFANGNMPGWQNMTWDMFLNQFFNQTDTHRVPLGEPWVLLILALGYVGYMVVRRARTRARGI